MLPHTLAFSSTTTTAPALRLCLPISPLAAAASSSSPFAVGRISLRRCRRASFSCCRCSSSSSEEMHGADGVTCCSRCGDLNIFAWRCYKLTFPYAWNWKTSFLFNGRLVQSVMLLSLLF
nr:uncharacterized protein LOC109761526 isoform X1 [Aegilops tauschii subsp. strangulata]